MVEKIFSINKDDYNSKKKKSKLVSWGTGLPIIATYSAVTQAFIQIENTLTPVDS